MDWGLSIEKLTKIEIKTIEGYVFLESQPSGYGFEYKVQVAVAQAQIEKSRAYQAQQTGDIQEKIRGKLQALLEIVAVVDTTTGIPWGLPDEEVIRLSNIVTLDLSTLLSQELAKRDEEWNKYTDMHDDVLLDQIDELKARLKEHKNALEFARGAIGDAIYLEDGLDGGTGQIVINMITEVLDDKDEYESTFKDGE